MRLIRKGTLPLVAVVFSAHPFLEATAQEPRSRPALDEVVVLAERRAASISDVPVSLTVLTEETIRAAGIDRIDDFATRVPNFTLTAGPAIRSTRINIRGVSTDSANIGISSSVPVYIDGIVQGRLLSVNSGLYDLESIEVLRGPQGTLFGRNAIAGAVLMRTRTPNPESFETSGRIGVGNKSFFTASGTVNIPLSDQAALKLSAATQQRDGFEFNETLGRDVNNLDDTGVRVQFLWAPSDQLELIARYDYGDAKVNGYSNDFESFPGDPGGFDRIVQQDFADYTFRRSDAASLEVNYELNNGFVFSSLSGYQEYDSSNFRDIDMTAAPFLNTSSGPDSQSQFSQEFRVTSPLGNTIDWVGGLFYFNETTDTTFTVQPGGAPFIDVGGGEVKTRSWSAFGQLNYHINEDWTLTTGLRWTQEEKRAEFFQADLPAFGLGLAERRERRTDKEPSGTVRLAWNVNENWMTFGGWSRGFKASGYNIQPATPESFRANPEFLDAWELGAKAEYGSLRFSATGFFNKYRDLQVSRAETPPGGGVPIQVFGNAGRMEAVGVELEVLWVPVENLDIGATYGYLDAEFKEFEGTGLNLTGNVPNRAPRNAFSTFAQYRITVLGFGDVQLRGDYSRTASWFDTDTNVPRRFQPSVGLLNARIGFISNDGRWSVTAWGKNLTDELHATQFSPPLFGTGIGRLWAPGRTYGLDLTWNLGSN